MIQFLSMSTNRRRRRSSFGPGCSLIGENKNRCHSSRLREQKKTNGTNYDLDKYVQFQKIIIKSRRENLHNHLQKSFGKNKVILFALAYLG